MNNNEYVCRKCQLWTAGSPNAASMCSACCVAVPEPAVELLPVTGVTWGVVDGKEVLVSVVSDNLPLDFVTNAFGLPPAVSFASLLRRCVYEYDHSAMPSPPKNPVPMTPMPELREYLDSRGVNDWQEISSPTAVAEVRALAGLPPLVDDGCCGK